MHHPDCLNCGHPVTGNYCQNCGQKASTHRFTLSHIFSHDLVHGLFHVDKGALYTVRELFVRPGYSIREYIEGKRVNHFSYITLLLLLIAARLFIEMTGGVKAADMVPGSDASMIDTIQHYMQKYIKQLYLVQILLFSLVTWLMFRRSRQNYAEHLVMNTYKECGITIITCFFLLLQSITHNKTALFAITAIQGLCINIYIFRFLYQYFKPDYDSRPGLAVRTLLAQFMLPIIAAIVFLVMLAFQKMG